jgi:hypothetical protein
VRNRYSRFRNIISHLYMFSVDKELPATAFGQFNLPQPTTTTTTTTQFDKFKLSFLFCPSSIFYVNLYDAPRESNRFWPWQTTRLEGMACHLLQKH